jgi:hypothetical protein
MEDVNERTTALLEIKMYNQSGALAAPTSANYTIHDLRSGTTVRISTALAGGDTVPLTLTEDDTKIINVKNKYEIRRVTVIAEYGASDYLTGEYDYRVKNLAFVDSS